MRQLQFFEHRIAGTHAPNQFLYCFYVAQAHIHRFTLHIYMESKIIRHFLSEQFVLLFAFVSFFYHPHTLTHTHTYTTSFTSDAHLTIVLNRYDFDLWYLNKKKSNMKKRSNIICGLCKKKINRKETSKKLTIRTGYLLLTYHGIAGIK